MNKTGFHGNYMRSFSIVLVHQKLHEKLFIAHPVPPCLFIRNYTRSCLYCKFATDKLGQMCDEIS
jgi:hypothetical protein